MQAADTEEQEALGSPVGETAQDDDQDAGPSSDAVEDAAAEQQLSSTHGRSDSSARDMQPPNVPLLDTQPAVHDAEAAYDQAQQADADVDVRAGDHAGASTHRSLLSTSSAMDSDLQLQQQHGMSPQASSTGMSSSLNSRPGSAAQGHLRGSRPCSAAIAAQIEGFEDDFLGAAEAHNALLDEVPEDDGGSDRDAGPTTEELIAEQQQELAVLQDVNDGLQQHARQVLEHRNRGRPAINRDMSRLEGADARYRMALKAWVELRKEREQAAAHYQATIFEQKAVLEGRIQRAEEVAATLQHFKREVALGAEDSKTGRPVPRKALAELEEKEQVVDEEVQRVRLKNIHLANALKKLESRLRNKEQLAEGLHLIDFEQLKIENNSLNEKIEERNEELIKLRKKTTVTVQILTHMKAKLVFVECENAALREDLMQVEAALAGKRDELSGLKATRDRLRQQGRQLKEGSVFVTNPMLLHDMQAQKEKRDDLLAEIELLKQQHAALTLAGTSTGGSATQRASSSRAGSLAGGAASPPAGKLQSARRTVSSKAASAGLQMHVSSAPLARIH